jgi:hypothetical protein
MGLAGRNVDVLGCYGKGQLDVAGSFAPNGGSNPVAASNKGSLLASVVWTSTGTWTVTLRCRAKDVIKIDAGAQINSAANVNTSMQIGAVSSLAPVTFVIRNNPGGAVADIAADASNRINFTVRLQTGAVK